MKPGVVAVLGCVAVACAGCGGAEITDLGEVEAIAWADVRGAAATVGLQLRLTGDCATPGHVTATVNDQVMRRAATGGRTVDRNSVRCDPAQFELTDLQLDSGSTAPLRFLVSDRSGKIELDARGFSAQPTVVWSAGSPSTLARGQKATFEVRPADARLLSADCWYRPTGAPETAQVAFQAEIADGGGTCTVGTGVAAGTGQLVIRGLAEPADLRCSGASRCQLGVQFEGSRDLRIVD